ncbi:hypothetical protein [Amycolatopsis tucumanensis]|uniref:Uncharacterized protein n=1 Tax=Amycolatopsis tucumanensis TaxID=401106 RepID=A0ABP7HK89_9PSEU|nr:hypothetical protein [Amycolatopsis tucumanensis]
MIEAEAEALERRVERRLDATQARLDRLAARGVDPPAAVRDGER